MALELTATIGGVPVNNPKVGGDNTVNTAQAMVLAIANEIVPGILAAVVLGATAWIAVNGHPVPEVLSNIDFAVVAFYFGVRGRGAVNITGSST